MLDITKIGTVKYGEKVDHLYYDGKDKSYGIYQRKNGYEICIHYKNQDKYNDIYACSSLGSAFETIEALENGETI